ncbi:hypothetical protein [Thioflexithrix psekupsensis]|uniref:SPOR domain-containing protein n=1 Tax=Thioflexithrix psekupsensis TaxID=1570016 RepID=A0A251X3B8_9GAMM|nr:hypothetical protein [Thioflexithrix psekupsensis]OUD11984.1 hypothetical protein TPSD3_12620 [Thioflexithrix psekupsensis]
MKILALLLLLANIIFFAWQQHHLPWIPIQPEDFIEKQQIVTAEPADPRLLPLLLLSEYKPTPEELAAIETAPRRLREAHPPAPTAVAVAETESSGLDLGLGKIFDRIAERATETQAIIIPTEETQNDAEVSTVTTDDLIASEEDFTPVEPVVSAEAEKVTVHSEDEVAAEDTATNVDVESDSVPLRVASADNAGQALALPESAAAPEPELPETTAVTPTPVATTAPKKAESPPNPAPTPAKTTNPPSSTGGSICYKIGPYVQSASVNTAAQWFNQRQTGSAKVNRRDTPILEKTRVYLPPFAHRQEAVQAQQRLEQQGIQDYYINKDHSISLGVFRDLVNVQNRLAELNRKGFNNVKTQASHRSETRYWLDVKLPRSQQNLITQFDRTMNNPEVQTTSCP